MLSSIDHTAYKWYGFNTATKLFDMFQHWLHLYYKVRRSQVRYRVFYIYSQPWKIKGAES